MFLVEKVKDGNPHERTYEYDPIGESGIRLLYLEPGVFDDSLRGTLRITGDENVDCVALSYTWGPPVFSHRVCLGDKSLRVTESLHDALRKLRETNKTLAV